MIVDCNITLIIADKKVYMKMKKHSVAETYTQ